MKTTHIALVAHDSGKRWSHREMSAGYRKNKTRDWVWFIDRRNLITGGGRTEDEARQCFIDIICRTISENQEPEWGEYFQDLLAEFCPEMVITPEWHDLGEEKKALGHFLQIMDECDRVLWRWELGLESPEAAEEARKIREQIRQKALQLLSRC